MSIICFGIIWSFLFLNVHSFETAIDPLSKLLELKLSLCFWIPDCPLKFVACINRGTRDILEREQGGQVTYLSWTRCWRTLAMPGMCHCGRWPALWVQHRWGLNTISLNSEASRNLWREQRPLKLQNSWRKLQHQSVRANDVFMSWWTSVIIDSRHSKIHSQRLILQFSRILRQKESVTDRVEMSKCHQDWNVVSCKLGHRANNHRYGNTFLNCKAAKIHSISGMLQKS